MFAHAVEWISCTICIHKFAQPISPNKENVAAAKLETKRI